MADKKVDWGFDEDAAESVPRSATPRPADATSSADPARATAQETRPRDEPPVAAQDELVERLSAALALPSGAEPFPWQIALLKRFVDGDLPPALDIPTGLGKTAVMAIWLVARSANVSLPRRLVYVVDRRAVVDQATDVAERLRDFVNHNAKVAKALDLDGRSLPISTLRGQHVDNREWLEDPGGPAIVVGTVDMIGSRLLFEAYRCSRKMRPYHAALIGTDAFIVLDEAHLVPPFEALVKAAVQNDSLKPQPSLREVVPPSQVMSLSATGRGTEGEFKLDAADRNHEAVKRRLDAKKRLRIAPAVEASALAERLAAKAWELRGGGSQASRVLVFVDSRKTAQEVNEAIEKLAKGDGSASKVPIEVELFVGGRRVAERQKAATRLVELGLIAGSNSVTEKPVFVIATSAGEVGVDLDADHSVLDLVEWERMVQRLGRVNRRGEGEADVWIVPTLPDDKTAEALLKDEKLQARQPECESDTEDDDAVDAEGDENVDNGDPESSDKPEKKLKEDERRRVLRWRRKEATLRALRSLPASDGAHDASPRALTELKSEKDVERCLEDGSTPAPLHPELTRAVVESWSMTSLEQHAGRPNVRPWLRGWVEEEAQTTVVWRTWLPRTADAAAFFEAAPVETAETLEVDTASVFDWLTKRVKHSTKSRDAERPVPASDAAAQDGEEMAGERPPLTPDDVIMFVLGDGLRGWTLAELDALHKNERDQLFRDMAGETIVVDTRLGGLGETGLLDPKEVKATDVSETFHLPFRVREVESLEALANDDGWRVEDTFVSRSTDEGEAVSWLVVETELKHQSTTADGRSTGREQRLDEHQELAERHARRIGQRVGLPPELIHVLVLAAALHDEGKKAERWQRAFRAPKEKRPLAKTTSRPIQSILARYRHELGSLPYAERDPRTLALSPEDRDLLLHLIAAHHGFARPILRTDGCDKAPPSALVEGARTVALRFARLEKRWGPWGLAWWETLLRAADQAASRENDERGVKHG